MSDSNEMSEPERIRRASEDARSDFLRRIEDATGLNDLSPALTPAEWVGAAMDDPSVLGDVRYVDPNQQQKIVALANSLLPDDSPYKITWADVEAITSTVDVLRREFGQDDEDAEAMASIAAKLAALLPPETP